MTVKLILHFIVILCSVILQIFAEDMGEALKNSKIVPDVIDSAPTDVIDVSFPSGVKAELGNKLTPTQVKDAPQVNWKADSKAFYTLAMVDPDAPSRQNPKFREWHHWLIGNIPGNNLNSGDVLTAFISSAPPENTGYHRYIFLVYKQSNGKINFEEKRLSNDSGEGRGKFSIRKFAKKYNLGNPIAANYYEAQYDDYVPKAFKRLGA